MEDIPWKRMSPNEVRKITNEVLQRCARKWKCGYITFDLTYTMWGWLNPPNQPSVFFVGLSLLNSGADVTAPWMHSAQIIYDQKGHWFQYIKISKYWYRDFQRPHPRPSKRSHLALSSYGTQAVIVAADQSIHSIQAVADRMTHRCIARLSWTDRVFTQCVQFVDITVLKTKCSATLGRPMCGGLSKDSLWDSKDRQHYHGSEELDLHLKKVGSSPSS